ncbi:MAG: hypothetical protein K9N51_13040 [Candidatus Pacebacteria bacterium]|nr:hypothetical protein [Candidatus Paceibacterota bacterium]
MNPYTYKPRLSGVLLTAFMSVAVNAASRVCFEGEDAETIEPPVRVVSGAEAVEGASNRTYLEVPPGAGKPPQVEGRAVYTFAVPEDGRYKLWCRVYWPDGCGNSFGMRIDDNPEFTFGQDGTYNTWHWVEAPPRLEQLELRKGTHTLTVMNREDGPRLDQVLFTTNRRYVPVAIESVTDRKASRKPRPLPDYPWRVGGKGFKRQQP